MVGYLRVPPVRGVVIDGPQSQRLFEAGCDQLFHDRCYGLAVHKPGLDQALAAMKPGDVLAVINLHAFAAHLVDLLEVLARLEAAGVHLLTLAEGIDTRQPGGFFAACARLATFHDQRRMVRTAEEKIVREGGRRSAPTGQASDPLPDLDPDA
ncbi:MAG TPA: recombinase family protein [Caulobacter sp.]|nr:recombinase family protein [Caulobacter sp.]